MPSYAFGEYLNNLRDVHRLVLLHASLNGSERGRRGLGHLTRGGVLLLCAAWERYTESVLVESATYLQKHVPNRTAMPANVAQRILNYANSNNNAWTAARANGPTWGQIYSDYVQRQTDALNTPKYENLKNLFHNCIGVSDVASLWSNPSQEITDFVALRGEVAHRGSSSAYITIANLKVLEVSIKNFAAETDNEVARHLKALSGTKRLPWNRVK
ncbi:HEPN domain-containing protein [Xanthomonas campestris]|uniref:HEPN domain-containing protein n=1 Tax=Xanthomonas campestris TaxID=339 RepID=UPI003559277C